MKTVLRFASSLLLFFLLGSTPVSAASTFTYTPKKTTATSSWYSSNWTNRIKITINHEQVGEEVTDFPVYIKLNENLTGARDDRYDILFTSSDGVTKLAYERETATDYWVKVPKLTPLEDTVLYMYYGNPNAEDQSSAKDVWTNAYVATYHLNQDPASTIKDSTNNTFNAVGNGSMNKNDSVRSGKIGNSLQFNGTSQALSLNSPSALNYQQPATVSAWVKTNSDTCQSLLTYNTSSLSQFQVIYIGDGCTGSLTNELITFGRSGIIVGYTTANRTEVVNNEWHRVTTTFDGSAIKLWIDGVSKQLTTGLGSNNGAYGNLTGVTYATLGGLNYSGGLGTTMNGSLDEMEFSSVARTGGWIATEYRNQSDPTSFYTLSSPETQANTTLTTPLLFTYSTLLTLTEQATTHGGTILYQLSPNNGKTYYYLKNNLWTTTTKQEGSSAQAINKALSTLPDGTHQLKIKAFLASHDEQRSTLESLIFTYTKGSKTTAAPSLTTGLVTKVNEAFQTSYNRIPTFTEWEYWARRVLKKEKTTFDALVGAIAWQKNK